MAIVDLTVAYVHRFVAQTSFPASGEDSLQPLGVSWFLISEAILAKGAGDETHIQATLTFPTQYTYILKDFVASIRLSLGTTVNFAEDGIIQLDNCSKAPNIPTYFVPIHSEGVAFEAVPAAAADPVLCYHLVAPYKTIIERNGLVASTWTIQFADENAGATNAGVFTSVACFYVYNQMQAQGSILNTPVPIMQF